MESFVQRLAAEIFGAIQIERKFVLFRVSIHGKKNFQSILKYFNEIRGIESTTFSYSRKCENRRLDLNLVTCPIPCSLLHTSQLK
jgi:hypothetical protein